MFSVQMLTIGSGIISLAMLVLQRYWLHDYIVILTPPPHIESPSLHVKGG